MKLPALVTCVLAIAACLAGCARSEPAASAAPSAPAVPTAPAATTPPPTAAAQGPKVCSVEVTGSTTAAWAGYLASDSSPKVSVGSDYWTTEAQQRTALEWMGNALNVDKKTPEQLKKELEVNMKKDPRIAILAMNCLTDSGNLSLQASQKSKYKDVPFAPGSYVVSENPGPGEFQVVFRLNDHVVYHVDAGKLTLSKFDASGVAGTLSLQLSSRAGAKLGVAATLDFPAAHVPTPGH